MRHCRAQKRVPKLMICDHATVPIDRVISTRSQDRGREFRQSLRQKKIGGVLFPDRRDTGIECRKPRIGAACAAVGFATAIGYLRLEHLSRHKVIQRFGGHDVQPACEFSNELLGPLMRDRSGLQLVSACIADSHDLLPFTKVFESATVAPIKQPVIVHGA
jgi:hypothetical protein